MATQLSKGVVFNPGDIVDAADLNNLVDNAIALKGFIHTQDNLPAVAVVPADDEIVIWDSDVDKLRRVKVQALPSGVTSIAMTATPVSVFGPPGPAITTSGTFSISLDNQTKNKFLAGPLTGSAAEPAFRKIMPEDAPLAVNLTGSTPVAVDCTAGNVFTRFLTAGNNQMQLQNGIAGQRITIYLQQNVTPYNSPVHWITTDVGGTVRWPAPAGTTEGVPHTMTVGAAGRADIVNFLCLGGGNYWGTFDKNFYPEP